MRQIETFLFNALSSTMGNDARLGCTGVLGRWFSIITPHEASINRSNQINPHLMFVMPGSEAAAFQGASAWRVMLRKKCWYLLPTCIGREGALLSEKIQEVHWKRCRSHHHPSDIFCWWSWYILIITEHITILQHGFSKGLGSAIFLDSFLALMLEADLKTLPPNS